MASLKDLGLDADDYLHYIRGTAEPEVEALIDEHWFDDDFPWPQPKAKEDL